MKQYLICGHDMKLKATVLTNETVRVFDCITPQKSQIELPLTLGIENNDIVIIRDQGTKETEYVGIIDTVAHERTTVVLMFPFISIFDNECLLSQLDGDVYEWIRQSIETNYINTGDAFNDFAIEIQNKMTAAVRYERIIESNNFLDNLTDIFLNTGVYVKFDIQYRGAGSPIGIIAEVRNANEEGTLTIRYDNPIIVDGRVSVESSHTGKHNKAIIRVFDSEDNIVATNNIYLRDDNKLTTNPNDGTRIKQVKPKIIDYKPSDDEVTPEAQGEAVILLAEKALCGNSFDHNIEFLAVKNNNFGFRINRRCDYYAEDLVYHTYITYVKYVNDKELRVRLGAYRYTLTDRFKALRRKEPTYNSINGLSVSELFEKAVFYFSQDENGNLTLNYPDNMPQPQFRLTENNDLYFDYEGEEGLYDGRYEIDSSGELQYNMQEGDE